MDLEHVCALHRRWFRNLRVLVQRSDYVEYRLTSWFHGLSQDFLVRGGPTDEHRYWYEFIGPLASIRVDGLLDGLDGDLIQTENITYSFPMLLAPVFWALRPLFQRQKEDILLADTKLLERVYELEKVGFHRLEQATPQVVVYGGNGFFGRLMVRDLLEHSPASVIVASRTARLVDFSPYMARVKFFESDINNYRSVLASIEGAHVAVSCVGPFQRQSLNLLKACIEKRVHYVDVADDRDFVMRAHQLAPEALAAGITAFVGCSVVPGISSLLTEYALRFVEKPRTTKICISPGTRHPRGPGSFECLLSTVGEAILVPFEGRTQSVQGWSEREEIEFPVPMGSRHVYSIVDIADFYLQQLYFGTRTVTFKIGSELDFLNRLLSVLRLATKPLGKTGKSLILPISRTLIRLAAPFGTSQGGVLVEVIGEHHRKAFCVYAAENGQTIPAVLPSIAVSKLLTQQITAKGIVPLNKWLSRVEFESEFSVRGIRLAERDNFENWNR